ncbi:hypothetical protein ACQZ46_09305 [Agrobacterium salinitolerans]|uniref:hypothetical protein n=1 Tax=Agrobacterium TaxID=357 RepID=UPI00179AB582|nr:MULTISPECIES: hypothetical protein [Agrobacterium]MBA4774590.1 hypothetical protein [Hyphomicrobiales bacterium]MCZ7852441.1 hypothetical protein [Agrobacterium salinitolerans]MCZ7893030.1 hypothetical protein [Agrobacterium salinitolerans]MCZ7976147.1 hypothetical protein [Agrobacterium salinitolerans]
MHAAYDPSRSRFTYLDVSDAHGGEAFTRLPITEGDIFIGDRAYARAPSLAKLLATGADFIVRSGWHSIRLVTLDGNPVDWNAIYAPMKMGTSVRSMSSSNIPVANNGEKANRFFGRASS